jgi:hypothetical protein
MAIDKYYDYLQNRLIQTSQTGGQQYSDTSPFSSPWTDDKSFLTSSPAKPRSHSGRLPRLRAAGFHRQQEGRPADDGADATQESHPAPTATA